MSDSGDSQLGQKTRELPSVVVDLTPIKPPVAPRGTSELSVPRRSKGLGLVVLVYVIAAAALALSIYTRFF